MPAKLVRIRRMAGTAGPTMLAIAGDSAAGKTTLARGLVAALGEGTSTALSSDDYRRYDRAQRRDLPFTPLHPDGSYIDVMEQHLQLLATGEPVLKPVYDHGSGTLRRPELVEPRQCVIVEGLLPLYSKLSRACFDVTVYLAPPEDVRARWKAAHDTAHRGYTPQQVAAELQRREPDAQRYVRPQQREADIVISFGPIEGRDDPPGTPLSATVLLRPTIPHPNLAAILAETPTRAMHLKLMRDNGRPVDALHIHGYAPPEESSVVAKAIWDALGVAEPMPSSLGLLEDGTRNEPVRLVQLILLYHLLRNQR
jgi:phosphoribulokinase